MLVEGDDNLAVAAALELVPSLLDQVLADGFVVVELAVYDGVNDAVGRVEGLGAVGAEVVDRQTDVTQCC